MTTYSVQFGQMQQANEGLNQVHANLGQMVSDLNDEINKYSVNFQGNTRDMFFNAQKNYNDAHNELTNSLAQANAALAEIHQNYTLAENRGTQIWS